MDNNDILIRLRYALEIKNSEMAEIFKLGGEEVSVPEVVRILNNRLNLCSYLIKIKDL